MSRELFALWALCASLAALVVVSHSHGSTDDSHPPVALPCDEPESRVLAVLCDAPTHYMDLREEEPIAKRQGRLLTMSRAIRKASKDRVVRGAMIVMARGESGLAAYVYENRCTDGPGGEKECDAGRAKGPWQLHANDNYPEIPDSIHEQAEIAAATWRFGLSRCKRGAKDPLAAAFASYGSGGKCATSASNKARAHATRRVVRRLW